MTASRTDELRLESIERLEQTLEVRGRVTRLRSYKVRNHYADGGCSRVYDLDVVSHKGTDAVAVLPYWKGEDGEWRVMLARCFRPALTLREITPEPEPFIYEAMAGVMEMGEEDAGGPARRAAEELHEESGFVVRPDEVEMLGPAFYTSPGVYTEKIHLAAARVDPLKRGEPTRDGSVMEELLRTVEFKLSEALELCRAGAVRDAKTELALRRLADKLGGLAAEEGGRL